MCVVPLCEPQSKAEGKRKSWKTAESHLPHPPTASSSCSTVLSQTMSQNKNSLLKMLSSDILLQPRKATPSGREQVLFSSHARTGRPICLFTWAGSQADYETSNLTSEAISATAQKSRLIYNLLEKKGLLKPHVRFSPRHWEGNAHLDLF